MLHYNDDVDNSLNKRLHTMKMAGIIGVLMLIVSSIYQIIDYVSLPFMLRFAGNMSCGIINVMLLTSLKQVIIHVLVYILAIYLIVEDIIQLVETIKMHELVI